MPLVDIWPVLRGSTVWTEIYWRNLLFEIDLDIVSIFRSPSQKVIQVSVPCFIHTPRPSIVPFTIKPIGIQAFCECSKSDTFKVYRLHTCHRSYTETTNLNWFTQIASIELVTTVTDHQSLTIAKKFKF